jgi:hypothetical protein
MGQIESKNNHSFFLFHLDFPLFKGLGKTFFPIVEKLPKASKKRKKTFGVEIAQLYPSQISGLKNVGERADWRANRR